MSSIKTLNPTTGKVEKEYPEMDDKQIDQIIETAAQAYESWRKTSFATRAKLIHKVADIIMERKEELARLFAVEMGKPVKEGIAEVELCYNIFNYYADNAEQLLADKPQMVNHGEAFIAYEPIGVLLSVQPWNFPYYQITRSAAPNIMAGNTILLKHASNVPQSAELMEKIFDQAGAPKGVYTNLFVPGSKVSQLLSDPRIAAGSLTGSEPAGRSFAAEAGKYVKKTMLELGGSDPFIVMEDADINSAVQTAVAGRIWNAGQVCVSPKRIIVPNKMLDQFVEKAKAAFAQIVVGDPLDPETQLGPVTAEKAMNDILNQIKKAVDQGAKLVYGGNRLEREGFFIEPTILIGITTDMDAYMEEIFGPVMMIYGVDSTEEAIELANATTFGLGGTVFGKDTKKAVEIAREIVAGMVYINHVTGIAAELPFGGAKHSGYGREQAEPGIYEFVNAKLIRTTTPDKAY